MRWRYHGTVTGCSPRQVAQSPSHMCDPTAAMGRGTGCGSRVVCVWRAASSDANGSVGSELLVDAIQTPKLQPQQFLLAGRQSRLRVQRVHGAGMLAAARPHLARPGLAVNTSGPAGIRLAGIPSTWRTVCGLCCLCTCLSRARSSLEERSRRAPSYFLV